MAMDQALSLEAVMRRSLNYLDRMVDADGLPYFNIFRTDPAEAAHDWPDFGDVMSRQLQAAVMVRRATGETCRNEGTWRRKVRGLQSPSDGLLYRPATSFSEPIAALGDQALTLYALATVWADRPEDDLKAAITRMVGTMGRIARRRDDYAWFPGSAYTASGWPADATADAPRRTFEDGFLMKSLTAWARMSGHEQALDLAGALTRGLLDHSSVFQPEGTFGGSGHMHGNLRTLCGMADYAIAAGDPGILQRVDALYRYARSNGTRFGFLPEVVGRKGDIVSCETCALMDYVALGATLANHGHPEYWADVERTVRNQLVESQAGDLPWLPPGDRPDTHQFTWTAVGERMAGGWAGWSSPNHLLAADEVLHWGGPELQGKVRAFQNCCGGSGVHALFAVWRNVARYADGTLRVNMHLDKGLPEAEVRCGQPCRGELSVDLRRDARVLIRVPEFVRDDQWRARASGQEVPLRRDGVYADMGPQPAGARIVVHYPLPVVSEHIAIGNPGFRHYRYDVTWKGDTVVEMAPFENEAPTGYSDFDQRSVSIYYGAAGPSPLYQRRSMLPDKEALHTPLHEDTGALDFWA